jgi:hypothetical protein
LGLALLCFDGSAEALYRTHSEHLSRPRGLSYSVAVGPPLMHGSEIELRLG